MTALKNLVKALIWLLLSTKLSKVRISSLNPSITFKVSSEADFKWTGSPFLRPYNLMCKDEQFLKVNQNWV